MTQRTTRSETREVPRVNVEPGERFSMALPQQAAPFATGASGQAAGAAPGTSQAGSSGGDALFAYDVPEGWTEIAPTQFRNPNFVVGDVEAYVSVLPGQGGGVLTNANRWRGQLGQPPYSEDEFARLPRAEILGQPAVIVDFTGDFHGMGAADAQSGYRLVGALIEAPMASIFLKMVGPDAQVQVQKNSFAVFSQSLRMKGGPASGTVPAPIASEPSTDEGGASSFAWDVPEGWREVAHGSSMRLVTLRFGPQGVGECYVVVLAGGGGGLLDNFNRWLGQMGESPIEESELDLQPKVTLFGEEVPMLVAQGTYTGMGSDARPDHVMLGAIGESGGQSVFIKMVAPAEIGKKNWDNFETFCASLTEK